MPILIFNHLVSAYESLHGNRLRTSLTVLGVTIGIASITVILSLGAGATQIITSQIDQLGDTIAVIRPGTPGRGSQLTDLTSTLASSDVTSSLTEQDLAAIQTINNVQAVAPLMFVGGSVTADNHTPKDAIIVATTPSLADVTSLPIDSGQFIDTATDASTAVIGAQLSVDLFGTDQSIGKMFHTHGTNFRVIGVLKPLNKPVNYNNVDFDHAAIIDLDSGKMFNQGVAAIQQIDVRSTSHGTLAAVMAQSDKLLSIGHRGEDDYSILSGNELAQPTNQLFSTVAATLTTVAAISLLVGGIGIMNIMLVGVTERTREIGIRKALGASSAHITWQFLIESLVMSLAGGIFGYIVGYVIAFAIARTFLTFNPVFTWDIAGWSLGISLVVGIVFGFYPAIRAARKDPIESLRQYH